MSDVTITVYTTGPSCRRCRAVERHLDKKGVPFRSVRIDQDDAERDRLTRLGFKDAPVVWVKTGDEEEVKTGYRPDWLDDVAKRAA